MAAFSRASVLNSGVMGHSGVKWILGGWTAFLTENLVLSQYREQIIDAYGDANYHTAYNSLSTMACSSIAYGYLKHGRSQGPTFLVGRNPSLAKAGALLMYSIGCIGVSQMLPKFQVPVTLLSSNAEGVVSTKSVESSTRVKNDNSSSSDSKLIIAPKVRCPIDFHASDVPVDGGLKRISRHPALYILAALGLGSAFTTVYVTEMIFFGFPTIFAVVGGAHQDYRHRRGSGGLLTEEDDRKSSNIPFYALVMGRNSWSNLYDEMKWTNASLAVFVACILTKARKIIR